jgi:hypothetical protein
MRVARILAGIGAGAIVVLLARVIAYALEPSPSGRVLEHEAGGPALPVLTLVFLALGATLAVAICWLAALGVRERALLEPRRLARPPSSFHAGRALALALCLSVATSTAGGFLEAYIHWRAGLGWHGLHCVIGPLHRNLIPIETGLSFVAAALIEAAMHVVSWMRRTFALLREVPPRPMARALATHPTELDVPRTGLRLGAVAARAPPALA